MNDAPVSTDDSVTTNEDTALVLALSDFGTYSDIESDPLASVKITTLESNGSLEWFNDVTWVAVTLDQVISAADINAGNLRQQGLELDGDFVVTDNVRVFGALGYLRLGVHRLQECVLHAVPGAAEYPVHPGPHR